VSESVTRKRRKSREPKTHCVNDHEFTEDNTYIRPSGARDCRECMRARRIKHLSNITTMCMHCGTRPAVVRGLCTVHDRMVRVYGVPSTGRFDPEKARERRVAFLWENIDKRGPDECWPWTGKLQRGGYAQLSWLEGENIGAHRAAYEVTYGPIDPGDPDDPTQIDHLCHNPEVCKLKTKCPHRRCCNPAHLEAVPCSVNFARSDHSRPGNGGRKCLPGCNCGLHQKRAS
jgi:hypothetical protein